MKKIFSMLVLTLVAMTASAYQLTVGTTEHGDLAFKIGANVVTEAQAGDQVIVVVTPAQGYSTKRVTGEAFADWGDAQAPRRGAELPLLTVVPTGQGDEWTFIMPEANVEVSATYKRVIQNSWIGDIAAVTYNGLAQTPAVTVKDGTTTLVLNTDYSVAYSNNINAGTATVTVSALPASENYSGEATAQFTIKKADITNVTAPVGKQNLVYNATEQVLATAGSAQGGEMQYSLDGETYAATVPAKTNADTYTLYYKVVGDQNHNDVAAQQLNVTIAPATLTAMTLVETNFVYNRQEQTAQVATVSAGTLTVPAEGYDVSGNKGINVNNYTAKVTGKGNFTGEATAQFSIVPADAQLFTLSLDPTTFVYTSAEQKPAVTVNDGDAVLVEDTDYTLAFENTINAGTAKVTATGKGNYSGTKEATYTIEAKAVEAEWIQEVQGIVYNGQVQQPTVSVVWGNLALVLDTDYSVEYANNTNAGQADIIITGKGNYTGTATGHFTIEKADITEVTAPLAKVGLQYTGEAQVLIEAGSAIGGEMQYSLDGETWSTELPSATIPDTYTVQYRVVGDANHNDVAAQQVEVHIGGYAITVDPELKHGTITVQPYAAADTYVTVTVTPEQGYKLKELTPLVGTTVLKVDESLTFVMPPLPVMVSAQFELTPTNIVVDVANGNINDAIKAETDNMQKLVTGLTINLKSGATYTMTEPVAVPGDIIINGNGATIDAANVSNALVQLLAPATTESAARRAPETPVEGYEYVGNVIIKDANFTGVKGSIFYDNKLKVCVENFTIENVVLNLATEGVDYESLIAFEGGCVKDFTIKNSTVYGNNAVAKYFVRCSNGADFAKAGYAEGCVTYENNTFYGLLLSNGQWGNNLHYNNNATMIVLSTNKNIFVDCADGNIMRRLTNKAFNDFKEGSTMADNTFLNDGVAVSQGNYGNESDLLYTPYFKDAENGDFSVAKNTEQYEKQTGDPRWIASAWDAGLYNITVLESENGSVTAPKTAKFEDHVVVYITPAEGYQLKSVEMLFGKSPLEYAEDYSFYMPSGDITIKAEFEEVPATGIDTVNRDTMNNNQYYNLSGQRVAQPTRGLYIVNGKKIILK